MIARRYQPEDFAQIKEWGAQWGANYQEDQFPESGFIVDGVAAYFLYSTDSSVCWLENMVSKRGITEPVKSKALDLLVDAILKEAKELGFTVAYATTNSLPVVRRARENGATIQGSQFLLTKDLTKHTQLQ